jgi:mannose-1-phosphate guanylyltransferase
VRAVVLVGGFGTRLRPLTLSTPKQLLPVVHTTMIERVVDRLAEHGVSEVVLSLGYRPDHFREAFPDGTCAGVAIRYAQEPEPLDTAGAIAFAAREAGIDETFLAVNGDVLTDLDIGALWAYHRDRGGEATIALTPVEDPSRYGVVDVGDGGRVRAFVEKPAPGTAPSNWINAGTYVLEPSVLDLVGVGARVSIEREVFPTLAARGTLFALRSDAYWIDAGTPGSYLAAQLDLLDGRRRGGAEAGVHPAAHVAAGAEVERSVVDQGACIDRDAVVVDSIVMSGACVGAGAVVRNSIVGWGSRVLASATIIDLTVIGSGEEVASGASLQREVVPPPEQWA